MKKFRFYSALLALVTGSSVLCAQTIAEKKASFEQSSSDLTQDMQKLLREVNKELSENQNQLKILYKEVDRLYAANAPESSYKDLLDQINEIRQQTIQTENGWQELASNAPQGEGYALWHQPETTIGQLVIDYGSENYVYLLTPEIAAIGLSIDSNLPIPRASWDEMLELILVQNGIGIKQLNPFLRQLIVLKTDKSNLQLITNDRAELEILPPEARILFMLTPEPSEVKRVWYFLDKFINPNSTVLQMIGRDILIIAPVSDVKELLKLNDFVSTNRGDRDYKLVPLRRTDPEEMGKILSAIFDQMSDSPATLEKAVEPNENISARLSRLASMARASAHPTESKTPMLEANGLQIIPMANTVPALFLYGTREELRRAENIIIDVERHMGGAREKLIYWYTTKHTDPKELADILVKVYGLMIHERPNMRLGSRKEGEDNSDQVTMSAELANDLLHEANRPPPPPPPPLAYSGFAGNFFLDDSYIVNTDPREEPNKNADANQGRTNFIVDSKTGAIVMVVEADVLPKLKELIRKLDIPKKMVQLEVLLFEKRITNQDNIGLNLLRIGSDALNRTATSLSYNVNPFAPKIEDRLLPAANGITTFFISRKKSHMLPAYDAVYQFLISQEDVTVNANPSVLAINQTEAHIDISEEISVRTGALVSPGIISGQVIDTFARARYGIKIKITPTIHMRDNGNFDDEDCSDYEFGEESDYITLKSSLAFETPNGGTPHQPNIIRREINNEVRIADGQTVIIGGLRRKTTNDSKEAIPFLGEIPGIGKLFSTTEMDDSSVEMFIFITPKIITDPKDDLEQYRYKELLRRPGDVPYFLCELEQSRNAEKDRVLRGTMELLFGREPERCGPFPMGEYDGR